MSSAFSPTAGSYREVLQIAVPMIISSASWTIQHFIDRMFLSWYSLTSVQASLPAGITAFSIFCVFLGMCGYANTFVAQYDGAGMPQKIGRVIWQAMYLAVFSSLLLLPAVFLARPIFQSSGNAPAVVAQEIVYFQIMMATAFLPIMQTALSCFYTGRGKTWTVVWVNTVISVVNIVLDYGMIFGRWGFSEGGIAGAAWATVIAQAVGIALYLALLSRADNRRGYATLPVATPDWPLMWRMVRFGIPSGMQILLDIGGFTLFILLLGRLSGEAQAATTIAFSINSLSFMPMLGMALSVTTLVGKYIGMGKPDIAARCTGNGYRIAFVYMLVLGTVFILLPGPLFEMFRPHQETGYDFAAVQRVGEKLLLFIVFYNFFDAMNLVFGGALRGAGDTRFVMWMMFAVSSTCFVIPAYLVIVVFQASIYAAWSVCAFYSCTMGICFYLRYRRGNWRGMRVIELPAAAR